MSKLTAYWKVNGSGNIDIFPEELIDMSEDEIDAWVREGAELEVTEQGKWNISVRYDKEEVMEAIEKAKREMV